MVTVPAHSFCAPTRAKLIAAARFMPGVWAVFASSESAGITRTPVCFQPSSGAAPKLSSAIPRASSAGADHDLEAAPRRGGRSAVGDPALQVEHQIEPLLAQPG